MVISAISSSMSTSDKSVKERLDKFITEFNKKFANTDKKIFAVMDKRTKSKESATRFCWLISPFL